MDNEYTKRRERNRIISIVWMLIFSLIAASIFWAAFSIKLPARQAEIEVFKAVMIAAVGCIPLVLRKKE